MRITTYSTEIDPKTELPVLVRERSVNYDKGPLLQSPQAIMEMMNDIFRLGYATEEQVFLIAHNNKTKPVAVFQVSHGGPSSSEFSPRTILMKALLAGAHFISVCHNHPSNDPTPSVNDIAITNSLNDTCRLLGFRLLDHLIVCRDNYVSFKEEGLLWPERRTHD